MLRWILPSPDEIESKRNALLEKISTGKQAEQDLAVLEESIKAISALVQIGNTQPKDTKETSEETPNHDALPIPHGIGRPKRVSSPLGRLAEAVIREHGKPVHIDELMASMRGLGWVSTGDYKLDMKNVFNTLSASKRFTNLGRNTWDMTENVKPNEEKKLSGGL